MNTKTALIGPLTPLDFYAVADYMEEEGEPRMAQTYRAGGKELEEKSFPPCPFAGAKQYWAYHVRKVEGRTHQNAEWDDYFGALNYIDHIGVHAPRPIIERGPDCVNVYYHPSRRYV